MNGLLLIDKPLHWTSFDVVAKVRGILRQQQKVSGEIGKIKVGHAGTLDPLATGLMLILVGDHCKRASEFSKLDKSYAVTACLGQTSTTGDEEGAKTLVSSDQPTLPQVEAVLQQFTGQIQQTPPAYSAVKVNGQRAYKLARAGQPVTIEPRTVSIYSITDVVYNYPSLAFVTNVSSGTYIRSLVEDIGRSLATSAYTTSLRRLSIGQFKTEQAQTIDNLDITNL